MKNIFKTNNRGIIAILTLCILLNTIGICAYATTMPEENSAVTEDTTVVVEETVVATEKPIIVTEENIVVTEENAQELMPMMANQCEDDYSDILPGKPYVPDDCIMVRNDVASVKSPYFIQFVVSIFGSFKQNEWKKHMETWEDDDGNRYECHYWQGPNGVTYYHN